MYCRECGKKLAKGNNYCNNCGNKVLRVNDDKVANNKNVNNKNVNDLLLLISLISFFGVFLVNVFILPLLIFGIIMSIKYKDKVCLIINIVSFFVLIVIFVFVFAIMFRFLSGAKEKAINNVEDYYDKFKDYYKDDYYKNNDFSDVDVVGTWYLYNDSKIDDSTYYKFNSDNSFTYYVDDKVYIGTYTIDKNISIDNEEHDKYKLELNVISLIESDKKIVDSNLNDFSYNVSVDKETMEVVDLSNNTSFVLKKDAKVFY